MKTIAFQLYYYSKKSTLPMGLTVQMEDADGNRINLVTQGSALHQAAILRNAGVEELPADHN